MNVFTNHPVFLSEGMDPFNVSVGYKCEACGRVTKTLKHECFEKKLPTVVRETMFERIRNFLSTKKISFKGA